MRTHARTFVSLFVLASATTLATACLDRPVSREEPTTKSNVLISSKQSAVDKIDLLFMIDNSASMADKQEILAEAVPDLVASFVTPACLDTDGKPTGEKANPAAPEGQECAKGKPEFRPIVDIHIGIVTSSMGGFGGGQCEDPNLPRQRDGARLVARGPGGATVPGVGSSQFLAWLPDVPRNAGKPRLAGAPPITDLATLGSSASAIVKGVGDTGCGLEAQLESVYHFLSDPIPHESVALSPAGGRKQAALTGLDRELLTQRAEFLRPDSLVAVVMLTDEDDSQVDPTALNGFGHYWASLSGLDASGGQASPRGTSTCAATPYAPSCLSCRQDGASGDPECQKNGGFYSPAEDVLNVRFHKMKSRFGVDPQYPLERYKNGLTSLKVPGRAPGSTCRNPLFAKGLPLDAKDPNDPRLCNLEAGPRQADQVYFAVIGGVPQDLLHYTPDDEQATALTDADWDKIVGKDADHYARDEGIDPRMVQSTRPRAGRPGATATSGDNAVGGEVRDWETDATDLQYACTFPLRTERDCSDKKSCDCNYDPNGRGPILNPPLCDKTGKKQTHAKAYPTPRELRVARMLGKQGIAGSLCPISFEAEKNGAPNPLYGYRPAVATIVGKLKGSLISECLPQKLDRDADGLVSCVAVHALPEPGAKCESAPGLTPLDAELAESFLRRKRDSGDTSFAGKTLCRSTQLPVAPGETCAASESPGYCYVDNAEGKRPLQRCSQAVVFSKTGAPRPGVTTDLLCVKQSGGGAEAR